MSEKVQVSWQAIMDLLLPQSDGRPGKASGATWTAHCGCHHEHDGGMTIQKCPGHAAGQQVVEAERQ